MILPDDCVEALAKLFPKLTYKEMSDFAEYIAEAARTTAGDEGSDALDTEYFAVLLLEWAESQTEE